MEIPTTERLVGPNDLTQFGLPTNSGGNLERSREALLLRLETMRMKKKHDGDSDNASTGSDSEERSVTAIGNQQRSKAIPIKKTSRRRKFNSNEGRGFTDDMLFFASACNDNNDNGSDVDDVNEPFVPPHLQQNNSFVGSFV